MAFVGILSQIVTLWAASYSACVVYTKTIIIIHLSVGESGGYLTRRFVATSRLLNYI